MAIALLTTKLYLPQPRPQALPRLHLIARLQAGLHHRLTLISAPPGFGKTTLVSLWIATSGRPAAWLSLNHEDQEPTRFLAYLVAALQTLVPTIARDLAALLQLPQSPPIEALLPMLLNEIATLPEPAILVLDDYHLLDARPIDQLLTVLIEHLPPQLHLVMTTRTDPALPLSRLRARDQLTELRATDLSFTTAEVAIFLKQVMRLHLSEAEMTMLAERSEGWIAGLQLAALSMQGQQDLPRFVRFFVGDHRYIVDYLVEEVLEHQPAEMRSFLLQTAILDRLSGSLCDAVTAQHESQARLEALERANFFVVPLDQRRHWYRYHQLFGEALIAQLRAEQPEIIATLHQRASQWYEQHALATDAIQHALSAQDFVTAARLIELELPAMRRSRQETTLLVWLQMLPTALLHSRPMLCVGIVGALLAVGEIKSVEGYLRSAESWLETHVAQQASADCQADDMQVVDQVAFEHLPGAIAVYRAAQALALGKSADTVRYAQRALHLTAADDDLLHGAAAGLLGLVAWTSGDLDTAHRSYTEGMVSLHKAGHLTDVIGLTVALADIQIIQGRLSEAMRSYERGVQLATTKGAPLLRGAADMYVGMSVLAYEQNDLDAATQYLLYAQQLGEYMGLPQCPYRWCVAMAHIKEAQGDLSGALLLLEEAERRYVADFFPNVRPIAALRARLWLAQGRLSDALGWVREQNLSAEDTLSYLRERDYITLARVLMATTKGDSHRDALHTALGLLQRLLHLAEAGQRWGSVIEILLVQALVHQLRRELPAALLALSHALKRAAPEGYLRVFVDEGRPMQILLEAAAKHAIAPNYVRQLLDAFGQAEDKALVTQHVIELIEPLSEREYEVLRLLRTDMSGPEIARELMVSLNTLRTHTKRIYDKLGVHNRLAALRRAEELKLF